MEKRTGKPRIVRELSSGGVVFKREKGAVLWLVTKSTPSEVIPKSAWRLPKGRLDDSPDGNEGGPLAKGEKKAKEEDIVKTALKEVAEEGGVKARIVNKIGTIKYFYSLKGEKIFKFVTFYLMEWEKNLAQGTTFETEEVKWLEHQKARDRLDYQSERQVLDKAKEILI